MAELAIKVVFCHLLGDFVFQTNRMISAIRIDKLRSKYLYIHALIHLLLLLVITSFGKEYIIPVLLLAASHLLIDIFTKIVFLKTHSGFINLIADQSLHLAAIAVFVHYFYPYEINLHRVFNVQTYMLLTVLIILTFATSVFIKRVMSYFNYSIPTGGLTDAGKYIGILERLFIFLFVSISFWEGVGFLLAAKSIFRFGDLKENKDVKLTEYILIGTLLSFGIALFVSLLYLNVMKRIN